MELVLGALFFFAFIVAAAVFVWSCCVLGPYFARRVAEYEKREKKPKTKKIKKIKGVKPDLAMTRKTKAGLVPYGSMLQKPKTGSDPLRDLYFYCFHCSGRAIAKGRLRTSCGWEGFACYCEQCNKWTDHPLSNEERIKKALSTMKKSESIVDSF